MARGLILVVVTTLCLALLIEAYRSIAMHGIAKHSLNQQKPRQLSRQEKTVELRVFKFTGLTPLLMSDIESVNRKLPQLKLGTSPNAGDIEKIAAGLTYREPDGTLYVKSAALRSSLLEGCKGQKIPGSRMSPKNYFQAVIFTAEDHIPLLDAKGKPVKTWETQIDSGVSKASKTRIIVVRPRIPVWNLRAAFEFDREFAPHNYEEFLTLVTTIWNRAGRAIGIGAWRPQCSGKFGRYSVEMQK